MSYNLFLFIDQKMTHRKMDVFRETRSTYRTLKGWFTTTLHDGSNRTGSGDSTTNSKRGQPYTSTTSSGTVGITLDCKK